MTMAGSALAKSTGVISSLGICAERAPAMLGNNALKLARIAQNSSRIYPQGVIAPLCGDAWLKTP